MVEPDKITPLYPVSAVQKLTGLSGRQIRYYEHTNLVVPARSKGNQRLYSLRDIESLTEIKRLISSGLNIEGVRKALKNDEPVERVEAAEIPSENTASVDMNDYNIDGREEVKTNGDNMIEIKGSPDSSISRRFSGTPLNSLYPVRDMRSLQSLLEGYREKAIKNRTNVD